MPRAWQFMQWYKHVRFVCVLQFRSKKKTTQQQHPYLHAEATSDDLSNNNNYKLLKILPNNKYVVQINNKEMILTKDEIQNKIFNS